MTVLDVLRNRSVIEQDETIKAELTYRIQVLEQSAALKAYVGKFTVQSKYDREQLLHEVNQRLRSLCVLMEQDETHPTFHYILRKYGYYPMNYDLVAELTKDLHNLTKHWYATRQEHITL